MIFLARPRHAQLSETAGGYDQDREDPTTRSSSLTQFWDHHTTDQTLAQYDYGDYFVWGRPMSQALAEGPRINFLGW